ncbi:Crp/Fnr family transcriptional regulator [Sphingomonas sp. NBWT7]|uniref:Crp/Fnr family transcriptional regulator n=1 Tax=Sphingomonas sp. NBWT7 TaxID=2596913 RepID=UPI001629ED7C|nr:Crp/Fnr family transcriptional regulator [Sphingomonas sp. NBWT7]QNE32499.1 Crp/Fnr family transcriptional regulator [Sphingomonas sp. NBWT7]
MSFLKGPDPLKLFLAKVEGRSKLNDEECDGILGLPVTPRQVQPHREIVRLGDTADHACIVANGIVARFAQVLNGARQIVSMHVAGDMVDLHSLMLPAAPAPLVALTSTTILQIPHAALRDLVARFPGVGAALWRECVIDGNIVAHWLVNVGRRDARARLAHLICELAVRSNQIGNFIEGRFPMPITQDQIADALGLTSVHVNRMMQSLRGEGLLESSGRETTVLDWQGLVRVGEFDPHYLHLSRAIAGLALRHPAANALNSQ